MTIAGDIAASEQLGRSIFSSKSQIRARRGNTPHHVFLERSGVAEISVDRLDYAHSLEEAASIAIHVATKRSRTFYGWAVVTAEHACANGRRIAATPNADNPYHGDIVLPPLAAEDREEQKRHAQELADLSVWKERPGPAPPGFIA